VSPASAYFLTDLLHGNTQLSEIVRTLGRMPGSICLMAHKLACQKKSMVTPIFATLILINGGLA
jgi:hypothetical protein